MRKVRLRFVFQLAIMIKERGGRFYGELARSAPKTRIKKLYSRLAGKEEAHRKQFEKTLSQWGAIATDTGLINSFSRELEESGLFKNPPPPEAKEEDVIKYAIEQEKKVIAFFQSVEGTFPESWKRQQVQELVKTEKEHQDGLARVLEREKLGGKKYILLVDDDPAVLKTVALWLSKKGYRAVPVETRDAAMSHVDIERPDLVLLDIMMPDADGISMLQEIKEIDKDIPVIMLTAVWDEEEEKKCKRLGALAYLQKPVDLNALEKTIVEVFSSDE